MAETKRKRKGLGRGLSSLLDDVSASAEANTTSSAKNGTEMVSIDLIRPNPDQPRRTFATADMNDLTNSIKEKGVLQPLLVRPDPDRPGGWTIVAGERRWRAAQMAKLHELPIIARDFSDEEMLEVAIIENVQRADLNAVEEARGYKQLIDRFAHTQDALAKVVGKSRPHIANTLRLLALPEYVQDLLVNGTITAGHARAIATAANPSELARRVVNQGLSVRQTEELARHVATSLKPAPERARKDADTKVLEDDLSAALNLKVAIKHKGKRGSVTIEYADLDQLDGLCQLLMK